MVKLFLAEDEIAMRESIRRNIPWEEIGIEFCGEASDGELALPQILEQRPDIVMTDIKMPFMDGLQLAGLIRKELPDTKIVILSGYSEFHYAQEALRIGVTEYLLKPVTPRQLREVAQKLAASIEAEKKNREERFDWLEEEEREKAEHERRILFKVLVSPGMSSHDILAKADEIGCKLGAPVYRLFLFYAMPDLSTQDQGAVDEMLRQMTQSPQDCFVFQHSLDSLAILLTGRSEEEMEEKTRQLEERAAELRKIPGSPHYFLSAGQPLRHLSEMSQDYRKIYRTASYRVYRFFSSGLKATQIACSI